MVLSILKRTSSRRLDGSSSKKRGVIAPVMRQIGAFGDPGRDPRGRAVSMAFLAVLDTTTAARAGDDAADARWFPMDQLPKRLAFDHAAILAAAISLLEGRDQSG